MKIFDPEHHQLAYEFDYNTEETNSLREQNYETVSIDDLRRIALWKINRVLDIPEETLQELRALATTTPLVVESPASQTALRALTSSGGVGFPMASAFLKFIRPDVFPIMDVRAYRALTGKKLRSHQYTLEMYVDYAQELRRLAARLEVSLQQMDEQLYCFDKDHNGSINA